MAATVLRAMTGVLSWRRATAPLGLSPALAAPTGTAALLDCAEPDPEAEEGETTRLEIDRSVSNPMEMLYQVISRCARGHIKGFRAGRWCCTSG